MRAYISPVFFFLCWVACTPNEGTETDAGVDSGGLDGGVDDGGVDGGNGDERPMTLSPETCQADIEILREEDLDIREHPLAYKSHFYGIRDVTTADGERAAFVSLVDETVLLQPGSNVPGFPEEQTVGLQFFKGFGIAPDYGWQNDPDYPLAIHAIMSEDDITNPAFQVVLRSDTKGALRPALRADQAISGGGASGVIGTFWGDLRVGPHGAVLIGVDLRDNAGRVVVRQEQADGPLNVVAAPGMPLSTGDPDEPRFVGSIHDYWPTGSAATIVYTDVVDGSGQVAGTAFLNIDSFFGDRQCLATDTSILCGGVLVRNGFELASIDFASDGATIGAVLKDPTTQQEPEFHYKVIGQPRVEEIVRNEQTQGFTFNSFKLPKVCPSDNSVYFIGQLWLPVIGGQDELFRIDEAGLLTQVTDFGSLRNNPALKGQVPDEVRDWEIGYGCDAVFYTWGPSTEESNQGYEGYWASYAGGDTVEIIDETPGRTGENGTLPDATRARSGLDPNARVDSEVHIGPTGEFYFIPNLKKDNAFFRTYVVATEPVNRCRAPNRVNSDGDAADLTPGDGRCDTGATVGEDPECTFRAALEETNANPGSDRIEFASEFVVTVESALPSITSKVEIVGPSAIDGSVLEDPSPGLVVEARGARLERLTVRGFRSHGIVAKEALDLHDVDAVDNCGWGLWTEAAATISAADELSDFSGNGTGDGCEGGGIFASNETDGQKTLRLSDVTASSNNGPGIAALGVIELANVTTSENQGDGILVESFDGRLQTRLYNLYGTVTSTANKGRGVSVGQGAILSRHGSFTITDNCGWGIDAVQGAVLLGADGNGGVHDVSRNGAGGEGMFFSFDEQQVLSGSVAVCGGGGVSITGLSPELGDEYAVLTRITLKDNQGPGVASTAGLRFWTVRSEGNVGPGVLQVQDIGEATAVEDIVVRVEGSDNHIVSNLGAGIEIESGALEVKHELFLSNNHGSGAHLFAGNVTLGPSVDAGVVSVEGNGKAELQCKRWALSASSEWVSEALGNCISDAGVRTLEGDIVSQHAKIRRNAGPGLAAADPDGDVYGLVDVYYGEVCENGVPDEARMITYDGTLMVCSD